MFREDQRLPTPICDQTNGFQSEDQGKVRIGHYSRASLLDARIWRMTIYTMPKPWNESQVQKLLKARRWLIVTFVSLLLIGLYLCLNSTGRSAELFRVLWIGSFIVLVNLWNPFRRRNVYEEIAATSRVNSIEIDSDGLRMNWMTWSKFIPRNAVTQVEEPPKGRGMYVRTRRRFLWYVIPRRTDRYEEIKGELAAMGIPIVTQTSAPSNWGILFVFLFCASLLCNILTQDRRILAVNFALALILGVAGAILTNFWTEDRRLRRRSMLGSFLPAALSAVSLIFPFGLQ
jgi:hypothetical protein